MSDDKYTEEFFAFVRDHGYGILDMMANDEACFSRSIYVSVPIHTEAGDILCVRTKSEGERINLDALIKRASGEIIRVVFPRNAMHGEEIKGSDPREQTVMEWMRGRRVSTRLFNILCVNPGNKGHKPMSWLLYRVKVIREALNAGAKMDKAIAVEAVTRDPHEPRIRVDGLPRRGFGKKTCEELLRLINEDDPTRPEPFEQQDQEGKVEGMNPQEQKLRIRIKHLETALRMLTNRIRESALLSCSDSTASDVHDFIGDVSDMAERVLTGRVYVMGEPPGFIGKPIKSAETVKVSTSISV